MVSAFTPQTVSAFGPLLLMGVLYQAMGGLLAFIISEVLYVPSDFRWGILVVSCSSKLITGLTEQMGIVSNWGESRDRLHRACTTAEYQQATYPLLSCKPSLKSPHSTPSPMSIWALRTSRQFGSKVTQC